MRTLTLCNGKHAKMDTHGKCDRFQMLRKFLGIFSSCAISVCLCFSLFFFFFFFFWCVRAPNPPFHPSKGHKTLYTSVTLYEAAHLAESKQKNTRINSLWIEHRTSFFALLTCTYKHTHTHQRRLDGVRAGPRPRPGAWGPAAVLRGVWTAGAAACTHSWVPGPVPALLVSRPAARRRGAVAVC